MVRVERLDLYTFSVIVDPTGVATALFRPLRLAASVFMVLPLPTEPSSSRNSANGSLDDPIPSRKICTRRGDAGGGPAGVKTPACSDPIGLRFDFCALSASKARRISSTPLFVGPRISRRIEGAESEGGAAAATLKGTRADAVFGGEGGAV